MTILRPRSRSITVRLSEEEFATFQQLCVSTGARSISDLARKAMQEVLDRTATKTYPNSGRDRHSAQIRQLERKVEELATELAVFKAQRAEIGAGN